LRQPLTEALNSQKAYLPERFDQAIPLPFAGQERLFLPRILPIQDAFSRTVGAAVLLQDVTRFQLLDQLKSSLVATVSHQLKTPLTSIRLAVHLLLEEVVGGLNPKQIELLLDARDNAERLLATINNLLNLSRLESAQEWLDVHPESPATLLESVAEAIRPRAQDKNLTVEVDAPSDLPAVAVDRERLSVALGNLLDNAVTYTPPGGHITLSGSAAADLVTVTVTDTGPGIPEEHLPHVFEKFFRIPGRSSDSGTGLGLAIVHEIVTAHGGSISCHSAPGKGTTFHILLPVAQPSPAAQGAAPFGAGV
jgi:signal transduction histidine kinase